METLVNVVQNKNHKIINLIRFVGNSHVYQALKSNCFFAGRVIGAHKALFSVQIYLPWKFLEIVISGAVNPSTAHSPPVCSMFNEIVQYLKFFMFWPGVKIMTSLSEWWRHRENFSQYSEGVDLNLGYAPDVSLSFLFKNKDNQNTT